VKKGYFGEYYDSLQEYAALSFLQKNICGIAPIPYHADTEGNFLISERIDGNPPKQTNNLLIRSVAEIFSELHRIKMKKAGYLHLPRHNIYTPFERVNQQVDFLRDWFSKMNAFMQKINPILATELEKGSNRILSFVKSEEKHFKTRGFALIHYDTSPHNMIINDKGKLILIDWGQPYVADPTMDIAKFFYKSELCKEQEEIFFSEYKTYIPTKELRKRVEVYGALSQLGSYCWRTRVLNQDLAKTNLGKYIDINELNLKMQKDISFIREF
jgi:thiamine kinase-like enzyme